MEYHIEDPPSKTDFANYRLGKGIDAYFQEVNKSQFLLKNCENKNSMGSRYSCLDDEVLCEEVYSTNNESSYSSPIKNSKRYFVKNDTSRIENSSSNSKSMAGSQSKNIHLNVPNDIHNDFENLDDLSIENIALPTKPQKLVCDMSDHEFLSLFKDNFEGYENDYQRNAIINLLLSRKNCFANSVYDLSQASIAMEMNLELNDNSPVFKKQYPLPMIKEKFILSEVENLVKAGLAEPCISPYNSPVHAVEKKNKEFRMVVDMRGVNSKLKQPQYPLPKIENILKRIENFEYFFVLDLKSGFSQLKLNEKSRNICAYTVAGKQLRPTCCPQGIKPASNVFSYMMREKVWREYYNYIVFGLIDDSLCGSYTFDDHLATLILLFDRLEEVGLKMRPDKCNFGKKNVEFLGFDISNHGVAAQASKIIDLDKFEKPKNRKMLMSFLGFMNFYHSHIPNFAQIAAPLYNMTSVKTKFSWSTECENAFVNLKTALKTAPILKFPEYNKPFILETDASTEAIGGVIYQEHNEKYHPVAYVSKKLIEAKQKWSTTSRELYAIFYCLNQCYDFLHGYDINIYTDHLPLIGLLKSKTCESDKTGKLIRMIAFINQFNYSIQHKPGKEMLFSDLLSRQVFVTTRSGYTDGVQPHSSKMFQNPELIDVQSYQNNNLNSDDQSDSSSSDSHISKPDSDESSLDDEDQNKNSDTENELIVPSVQDILSMQKSDPICNEIYNFHMHDIPLDNFSNLLKSSIQLYTIDNDKTVKFIVNKELSTFVIPKVHAKELIEQIHISESHCGVSSLMYIFNRTFSTFSTYTLCRSVVDECAICVQHRRHSNEIPPLKPHDIPDKKFDKYHIDFLGPLPQTYNRNRYILVIVEKFSKYIFAYPTQDMKSETIIEILSNLFGTFGIPQTIFLDNAKYFVSKSMAAMFNKWNIKQKTSCSYTPRSNGQAEAGVQITKDGLKKVAHDNPFNWDELLPKFLSSYNARPQSSHGFPPYTILYGQDMVRPYD